MNVQHRTSNIECLMLKDEKTGLRPGRKDAQALIKSLLGVLTAGKKKRKQMNVRYIFFVFIRRWTFDPPKADKCLLASGEFNVRR